MQYININFIKRTMKEKGMSVEELSKKMKRSPRTLKKYLNGADQSYMTMDLPLRFARALEVPLHRLFETEK